MRLIAIITNNLTVSDLEEILEDSGYMGFNINTAKFAGTGDGEYAAVYACTDFDDSGISKFLDFFVFVSVTPNGTLRADF